MILRRIHNEKANTRKKNTWGLRGKDKEYSQYKKVFKAFMGYFDRCIIVISYAFSTAFFCLRLFLTAVPSWHFRVSLLNGVRAVAKLDYLAAQI